MKETTPTVQLVCEGKFLVTIHKNICIGTSISGLGKNDSATPSPHKCQMCERNCSTSKAADAERTLESALITLDRLERDHDSFGA